MLENPPRSEVTLRNLADAAGDVCAKSWSLAHAKTRGSMKTWSTSSLPRGASPVHRYLKAEEK
eukprot:9255495-Pyramimonas_sp.AAC.1